MAVFSAVEAILSASSDSKADVVTGLLTGDGEFRNVPCKNLLNLISLTLTVVDFRLSPSRNNQPLHQSPTGTYTTR